ncbi:MAG: carbonic anhydrase, partial [Acidobacteriota bacterium]|nr:carbonic anhydrase [Acidobacteriota bacterium]
MTTPAAALERLRKGNRRFAANALKPRDWSAKVVATASGQSPFAAVLGCIDSRVPIEITFDQGLGNVFAIRV